MTALRRRAAWLLPITMLLMGARCGGPPAEITELKNALHSGQSVDDLTRAARAAKAKHLADSDRRELDRLLAQTDTLLMSNATRSMDLTVTRASSGLADSAAITAQQSLHEPVSEKFVEDLTEVGKDLIKDQACQLLLDEVTNKPSELGERQTWSDAAQETMNRLVAKRYAGEAVNRVMEWSSWAGGVRDGAQQLADGLVAGNPDVSLFTRPPVQRAAVAYARFCYAVPHQP